MYWHPRALAVLEPERSGDRQPKAARRVSEANQCSSPLEFGVPPSGGKVHACFHECASSNHAFPAEAGTPNPLESARGLAHSRTLTRPMQTDK
jgi:hypothetical protein